MISRVRLAGGIVGAVALPAVLAAQSASSYAIRAENTLDLTRPSETLSLPWSDVRARLGSASPTRIRVLDGASGREIPSQAVDDDGNGTTDALIFQGSFSPHEIKRFIIEAAPAGKVAETRVYVAHMDPRDDVAWENDRIGYRVYGQGLWKVDSLLSSGVDVWVKRVRTPIIEKWYSKGHDSYHRDTGEGADFFDVGQSLGAGGTGIWRNGQLFRAWNFKSWRIIANGPVRAIFELQYQPWDAGGSRVSETKRVSIDAGQNLNHVVSVFRTDNASADIPWVTGLVKRPGVVGSERTGKSWARLSEWGALSAKDGGHGDLGIAVVLPRQMVSDWKETDDHYMALSHTRSGEPMSYWIGAGWTDSGDFRDVQDWWTYLDQWTQRLSTPIAVTIDGSAR